MIPDPILYGAGEFGKNSILFFTVTNISSVHAALLQRGAVNEREPALAANLPDHELWTGFLRDPDGNLVGLMEERRYDWRNTYFISSRTVAATAV